MTDINTIVVSSRVRLARNLEGLPFKTKKGAAYEAVAETIKAKNKGYGSVRIADFGDNPIVKALYEQHLISKELIANKANGIIVAKNDNKVVVMLGEEDHIRIQAITTGFGLKRIHEEAKKIADDIALAHPVAFRPDLGYLTSCPTNLGTAMRASVMMFLPALTLEGVMEAITEELAEQRITVRGVYGEGSTASGLMYQISNQACLGLSEQEILEMVESAALSIAKREFMVQARLAKERPDEIADQVFRAWGILTNALMMSSAEAVSHLSLLKLGACLGIIAFKNVRILDDLFFVIQPNTLAVQDNRASSVITRDKIRAARIAEILHASRIK